MSTPTTVIWPSQGASDALRAALASRRPLIVALPADLHHALFAHLYPEAAPGDPEDIDLSGGAELLDRIAEVASLEPLADLLQPAARNRYRVRVQSPSPRLLLEPDGGYSP